MSAVSASYHLRPVSEAGSPSSTASTSTASEHSPPFHRKPSAAPLQRAASAATHARRPLSPSSLRELDLSVAQADMPRRYPAPPTGHDLMALFPPAPPLTLSSGPTSGYFQQQERAFFAKKGKEIVRVQIEVDMPRHPDPHDPNPTPKLKSRDPAPPPPPRQWPPAHAAASPHADPARSMPPPPPPPAHALFSPQGAAHPAASRGVSVIPVTVQPAFPVAHHTPPAEPPHHAFPGHPSPGAGAGAEEYRDEPEDGWRRPMAPHERRRAGKHTKRVIVKS